MIQAITTVGPMREEENTKKQTWKQNCESQQFIAPSLQPQILDVAAASQNSKRFP